MRFAFESAYQIRWVFLEWPMHYIGIFLDVKIIYSLKWKLKGEDFHNISFNFIGTLIL